MNDYKLFMVLIGCTPAGRNIEQHDIFFGVAKHIKDLIPELQAFWPDSGSMHLDGYKTVTNVDGYQIKITEKTSEVQNENKLFFINLGGYKQNEFEEYHYKMLAVSNNKSGAIKASKETAFFKHTGFGAKASSHIDDKFGIDVDDIYAIEDILSDETKAKFSINISDIQNIELPEDELNLGYFKLSSL